MKSSNKKMGKLPQPPRRFFKVLMGDYKHSLCIPPVAARSMMATGENWKEIQLRSSLGKTWNVRIEKDLDTFNYFLKDGWSGFVEAHDLQLCYFLVFHHLGDMVFDVTVFDDSECSKNYAPKVSKRRVNDFDHEGPNLGLKTTPNLFPFNERQFEITLMASHLCGSTRMTIPQSFVQTHDILGIPQATLTTKKGCWVVNLRHSHAENRSSLGSGWKRFLSENDLDQNDVCLFEIKSAGTHVVDFSVTVKQNLHSESEETSFEESSFETDGGNETDISNGVDDYLSEKNSDNDNVMTTLPTKVVSFFEISMKPSHLTGRAFLRVPKSLVQSNDLWDTSKAYLSTTRGCWQVKIYQDSKSRFYLAAGLKNFLRENKFSVGDVCSFHIQSKDKKVVKFFVEERFA